MSDSRIDAERIAAFLDGRLSERDRDAMLAELAASDEARETLGDVAAVLRDLELAGDVPENDLPAPRRDPPGAPVLRLLPDRPPGVAGSTTPDAPADGETRAGTGQSDAPFAGARPFIVDPRRPARRRRVGGGGQGGGGEVGLGWVLVFL